MRILYLTNAMHYEDFERIMKYAKIVPNPSNQNFHYRLIKSLEPLYKVKVISQRPLNHKNTTLASVDDEIHRNFYYPSFSTRPIIRNIELYNNSKQIIKSLRNIEEYTVFVDLLNNNLTKLASHIKRKYGCKVVGILTDNPHNLTNVKQSYIKDVESSFYLCDGFITLNESLNDYANPRHLPHITINGVLSQTIIEQDKQATESFGEYVYFAGALYEHYGVKSLIEAVINHKGNYNLVLAGHGPLTRELTLLSENHPRIIFVGAVSPVKSLQYMAGAKININPRPFTPKLDKFAIPSKVIEYANSGIPTISTMNTILHQIYAGSLVWCNDDSNSMAKAIHEVLSNYTLYQNKAVTAKEIGEKYFGAQITCQKVKELLEELNNEHKVT